jgi:hypothetical protein
MGGKFRNLVGCFEPYIKKVAAIKSGDVSVGRRSIDNVVISKAISFTGDIGKKAEEYWSGRPIEEASVRVIYPYRHKTTHEARSYTPFEIERAIYYMFASIVFINLDTSTVVIPLKTKP